MTNVREVSLMTKPTEKEPLLFVDTLYKGCFVNEQSFFKTPTKKPNDIVADNYVHNFDQLGESSFQPLVPSEKGHEEVLEEQTSIIAKPSVQSLSSEDEDGQCLYETVNIVVNYDTPHEIFPVQEEQEPFVYEKTVLLEEDPVVTEEEVVQETQEESKVEVEGVQEEVPEEEEEVVEVETKNDIEEVLDEKQQEILTFIHDLTNRPSMMKAPIVQIVKKDGSLKSGMIELADDQHVTIDNMMDEVDIISIKEIDGIRILHL